MVSRGRVEAGVLGFLLGRPVEQVLRLHARAESADAGGKSPEGER
jgi:hypothetical protein